MSARNAKSGDSSWSRSISKCNLKKKTKELDKCLSDSAYATKNPNNGQLSDQMEVVEYLLQLLQEQPNCNAPKSYGNFQVQVNLPRISTFSDLLTTDSGVTSFTGMSNLWLLETIVEAVQWHYME